MDNRNGKPRVWTRKEIEEHYGPQGVSRKRPKTPVRFGGIKAKRRKELVKEAHHEIMANVYCEPSPPPLPMHAAVRDELAERMLAKADLYSAGLRRMRDFEKKKR